MSSVKQMRGEKGGRFAQALYDLLMKTNHFSSVEEWSDFLDVPSALIKGWFEDCSLPSATVLRVIVEELEEVADSASVNSEPLDTFRSLLDTPAVGISRNNAQIGPTLGSYLLRPLVDVFVVGLRTLPYDDQKKELLCAIRRVRRLIVPVDRPGYLGCDGPRDQPASSKLGISRVEIRRIKIRRDKIRRDKIRRDILQIPEQVEQSTAKSSKSDMN